VALDTTHSPICRRCDQKLENNKYFDIWTTFEQKGLIFVKWTGTLSEPMYAVPEKCILYRTLKRYKFSFMCRDCLVHLECRCIKELPLEDLPLHINTTWITEMGAQAYLKRLQTLEPLE